MNTNFWLMLSWKVQISWKIIPTVILKENGIGLVLDPTSKTR
jgi:hypothetical protein